MASRAREEVQQRVDPARLSRAARPIPAIPSRRKRGRSTCRPRRADSWRLAAPAGSAVIRAFATSRASWLGVRAAAVGSTASCTSSASGTVASDSASTSTRALAGSICPRASASPVGARGPSYASPSVTSLRAARREHPSASASSSPVTSVTATGPAVVGQSGFITSRSARAGQPARPPAVAQAYQLAERATARAPRDPSRSPTSRARSALALGCSRRAARTLVTDGLAYDGPLAPTGDALARGQIDPAKARVLVDARAVPRRHRAARTRRAGGRATHRSGAAPQASWRATWRRLDHRRPPPAPRAATVRAPRAHVDRPRFLRDGWRMWAVLPAREREPVDALLDPLARSEGPRRTLAPWTSCARTSGRPHPRRSSRSAGSVRQHEAQSGDQRVLAQPRRLLGRQRAQPDDDARLSATDDPERPSAAPRGSAPSFGCSVSLEALLRVPGTRRARGLRAITAETAGRWLRPVEHLATDRHRPPLGAVLDVGRTRYRPPADLADHVRARDRWCARPGCSAQAASCDLDHAVEYGRDGGPPRTPTSGAVPPGPPGQDRRRLPRRQSPPARSSG